MHVTQLQERTSLEPWPPPPRMTQRAFAHRAAAALVALTLGMGGSLMLAGTASAEELVDPAPIVEITDGTQGTEPVAPPADETPVDPAPIDPAPEEPGAVAPEVTEPESSDPAPATEEVDPQVAIIISTKVQFCHVTDSDSNPYTFNDTSVNGFFMSGHDDHDGDIVPPFYYLKKDEVKHFPGSNWNETGQMIWENECEIPQPKIQVTPVECLPGGETGGVSIMLTGLVPGMHYTAGVRDQHKDPIEGADDESFEATSGSKTITFSGLEAPGKYWAFVMVGELDDKKVDGERKPTWVKFQLEECPPLIPTVVIDPVVCTVEGGKTSSAKITLGSLTIDEEYRLSVYDDHGVLVDSFTPLEFTADAASKMLTVSGLPAPGTYKAVLEWMEDVKPHDTSASVEQSNVRPPKEELHKVEVWFALGACPAPKPTLASTGANGSSLPVGLGLLAIGSALLMAKRLSQRQQLFPPMV